MRIAPAVVVVAALLAAVGCSTSYHTVKLVNRTDRVIEEVYVYPTGSTSHGASRGKLEPSAATEVRVAAGNVDVRAVSAKVQIDDKTRERRTATQTLQLRGSLELVFHDSNQTPPGLGRPNTIGVVFRVDTPSPPPTPEPPE